jgi:hypothetical protein
MQSELIWENKFNLLKSFFDQFNRMPSHIEIYRDFGLGRWLASQRKLLRSGLLDQKHEDKLNQFGNWATSFSQKSSSIKTANYLNALIAFKTLNDRWPDPQEAYNDLLIGQWVQRQRQYRMKSSIKQLMLDKLNSINFDWALPNPTRKRSTRGLKWDHYLKELSSFKEEHKRWPKSNECYHGVVLGSWLYRQKVDFKIGKLRQEHQSKLKNIGVDLSINKKIMKQPEKKQDWYQYYGELVAFISNNNRYPEWSDGESTRLLIKFIYKARESFRQNNITLDKLELLNKINFDFSPKLLKDEYLDKIANFVKNKKILNLDEFKTIKNMLEKSRIVMVELPKDTQDLLSESIWQINYLIIEEHFKTYGNFPLSNNKTTLKELNIGSWIYTQRQKLKNNKLTLIQSEKLNLILTQQENKKLENWNYMFNQLKSIYTKHPNNWVAIKATASTDLLKWILKQKRDRFSLSQKQLNQLNLINFKWVK